MAVATRGATNRLAPILEDLARAISLHGLQEGRAEGAKAVLRVELEHSVRRVVQVYWTPFEADVPGYSVGLHLEVAEPKVHWGECYLSLDYRNWCFWFRERPDGEIELVYHGDYPSPREALEYFFNASGWYVLTPTGHSWADVAYQVAPELDWNDKLRMLAGVSTGAAIQDALKKSTIV